MEKISNYNTDGTMLRKQQERMFEMLCAIDDICTKNELLGMEVLYHGMMI